MAALVAVFTDTKFVVKAPLQVRAAQTLGNCYLYELRNLGACVILYVCHRFASSVGFLGDATHFVLQLHVTFFGSIYPAPEGGRV